MSENNAKITQSMTDSDTSIKQNNAATQTARLKHSSLKHSYLKHSADEAYDIANADGFALLDVPIDEARLKAMMRDEQCGALATFEGWVRNHNNGDAVSELTYYGYEGLALNQGREIMLEAKRLFEIERAVAIHRVGALAIGDMAVWIGVSSKHRYPAFDACRWILDTIKADIPVWKQEFYGAGNASKWLSNNG